MTTKLTYWDRSPHKSSQSAGDCTLDRPHNYKSCGILLHKGTCSSPWPGMVSPPKQATLWKGSLQQPPTSQFCLQSQIFVTPRSMAQHSQRVIHPKLNQKKKEKRKRNVGHRQFTYSRCPRKGHRQFTYSQCSFRGNALVGHRQFTYSQCSLDTDCR